MSVSHRVHARILRGRRTWLAAATLLVSLLLGAGLHEWHHFRDPGCGAPGDARPHACWCSSLHASVNVVRTVPTPGPVPVPAVFNASPAIPLLSPEHVASAHPRAPPLA
jgi:hypothetical protein